MKRVLMVAFHFPPHAGSSGIQRTLRFAQNLPALGWQPEILTVRPESYERTSGALLPEIPLGLPVHRTLALDAKRQLSIAGRYPGFLARPDRWRSWWLPAIWQGYRLLRTGRFDAIWSTFPIATAHRIGASLARSSRLPWVADLRDPMAHDGYPRDPATWQAYARVEKVVFARAAAVVAVSPGCADYYRRRYPDASSRIHLIRNGADPFSAPTTGPGEMVSGRFVLLHSGLIYPWERDPTALLDGLCLLRERRPDLASRLLLRLRAPGESRWLEALIQARQLGNCVEIAAPLPFSLACQEMQHADALLVLQAANCNLQIPAKLYEYARTDRPILALTDRDGDTWAETETLGGHCADLSNPEAIMSLLEKLLSAPSGFVRPVSSGTGYAERSAQLAAILDMLAAGNGTNSSD